MLYLFLIDIGFRGIYLSFLCGWGLYYFRIVDVTRRVLTIIQKGVESKSNV